MQGTMNRGLTLQSVIAILVSLALAGFVARAGSWNGVVFGVIPLFALCGMIAFAINWAAFVPAFVLQTEHFYDLTGSVTYLTVVGFAVAIGGGADPRALPLTGLVAMWALRLGSFLFRRIRQDGSDERFDGLKPRFARFLMARTSELFPLPPSSP